MADINPPASSAATTQASTSSTALAGGGGSSRRTARSPSSSSVLPRRRSTQERLDDILETARGRAEGLAETSGPSSPRLQPLLQRASTASTGRQPSAISEQDEAGLVQTQPPNYQSMTSSPELEIRARKSSAIHTRQPPPLQPPPPDHGDAPTLQNANRGTAGAAAHGSAAGRESDETWLRRTFRKFQSYELENKGSVARDHLALERTFLAWLRTSLAFASIGIGITQLFRLNTSLSDPTSSTDTLRRLGKPLGATFLAISIAILFMGYQRYFESQQWIMRGKFPASRGTIIVVSVVAFAVLLMSLVVVIVVHPPGS